MGQEMRKAFIGSILVGLIEKSPDVKVMKAINKMLEDWMKNKDVKMMNQGPSLKEKSILLAKMMQYVEKRFPDDADLNAQVSPLSSALKILAILLEADLLTLDFYH